MRAPLREVGLRIGLLAAVCGAGVLLASPGALGPASEPGGLWRRAVAAGVRRDHGTAEELLLRLLARDPDNPTYLYQTAKTYWELRKPREAASYAERYMSVSPHPTRVCPLLGNAYYRLGRAERSLAAHKRCLELEPDPENRFFYAQALEGAGKDAEAEKRYREILAVSPHYLGASLAIARIRLRQGRAAEAEELIQGVLKLSPRGAGALLYGAKSALALGNKRLAKERLRKAIREAPLYPDAHAMLGRLCEESGDRKCAMEAYSALRRLRPGDRGVEDRLSALERGPP